MNNKLKLSVGDKVSFIMYGSMGEWNCLTVPRRLHNKLLKVYEVLPNGDVRVTSNKNSCTYYDPDSFLLMNKEGEE